ncbi:MAG: sigma-70 family RNA polymerase sigma factor [Thermoanaerobaculia bacterium]
MTPEPTPVEAAEGRPSSATADEQARIRALLEGVPEALAELRSWVRGAVTPYRFRLAEEIEDLEQEVAIELLEILRAGRFEGRSLVATYVRRMVHYKCLNRLRAARSRRFVDVADVEVVDTEPTPFERARQRSELDLALRVLATMSEECRELWSMIHRGVGYEAMSERWGVAAGTLRVRVLRCRERALRERHRLAAGNAGRSGETVE